MSDRKQKLPEVGAKADAKTEALRAVMGGVEQAQPAQAGQVLTDDALWELWNAQGCDDMSQSEAMSFARAIEQAVLERWVPMTDAQIDESMRAKFYPARNRAFIDGVEAAELHHGIVGEKGGA